MSLLAAFGPVSPSGDPLRLEAVLQRRIDEARAAFPELPVSAERLARYLGERVPAGVDPVVFVERAHAADLLLACACAEGLAGSAAAFTRHCLKTLPLDLKPMNAA